MLLFVLDNIFLPPFCPIYLWPIYLWPIYLWPAVCIFSISNFPSIIASFIPSTVLIQLNIYNKKAPLRCFFCFYLSLSRKPIGTIRIPFSYIFKYNTIGFFCPSHCSSYTSKNPAPISLLLVGKGQQLSNFV